MTREHLADMQQVLRIESDAIAQTANRLDREQAGRVVKLREIYDELDGSMEDLLKQENS